MTAEQAREWTPGSDGHLSYCKRAYGTDENPMQASPAQRAMLGVVVVEWDNCSVHPYSGAMTLALGRRTVLMLSQDGVVTYDPRRAEANRVGHGGRLSTRGPSADYEL